MVNLGTIKGVTAHLKLKENAVPQFFKPRPVPFILKERIADELQRLEKIGVLEKVEISDWAMPIVPVLKPESGKKKWTPKSTFGEKKKKQQKVCFIEEDLAVKQSVSGGDWPLFTVSDSHGKWSKQCQEEFQKL